MNNAKNNLIKVVAQAFYGNGVATEINREEVDKFILGYLDNAMPITEKIDRTIIKVPNTDNIVIIYNKYAEKALEDKKRMKPLVVIPEENIELYSRCIVCRMNEDRELEDLQNEDFEKFKKYLAE